MAEDLKTVLTRNLRRALFRRDLEEAGALLAELKEVAPLALETRGYELECLLAATKLDQAERLAAELVGLFPASARMAYLAGLVAYRRRRYAAAEAHFTESYRLHPHWRVRRFLGKALTQAGRLDEAEPILRDLVAAHPQVRLDLAWLFERRGDLRRALEEVEAYLKVDPKNEFAAARRRKLRAALLEPEDVISEVEGLEALGEEVPEGLLRPYVATLIERGDVEKAREFIASRRERLSARAVVDLAWRCRELQAWDLALELFLEAFPGERSDVKFLSALEKAADRCGRREEIIALYRRHAPEDKRLYGRIQKLESRRR